MNKIKKNCTVLLIFVIASALLLIAVLSYLYPKNYSKYVEKYAKEYGIEEELIYAVIKCESNFKENSVSHAGAIGLMQITPDTFEWAVSKSGETNLNQESLFDPEINIKYGCYIYSLFYSEFYNQDVALASYNAGRGNVLSWLSDNRYSDDGILLKDIPFKETKNYVKKVENTRKIYSMIY